jgi:glycosyltransferase involved in cell wall biosynthesis
MARRRANCVRNIGADNGARSSTLRDLSHCGMRATDFIYSAFDIQRMLSRLINTSDPVLFMYLGRTGALGQFTLELSQAVANRSEIRASFAISGMNQVAAEFDRLGVERVLKVNTIQSARPLTIVTGFQSARQQLFQFIDREKPSAVINLMPHVWTPLFAGAIRRRGINHTVVIHDAARHPGDRTGYLTSWLRNEARYADRVVTLSHAVADQLINTDTVRPEKILTLFHPDLHYGGSSTARKRNLSAPLRLLFFGRILKYKGLTVLIDAIEMLRREGIEIRLGVAGIGDIRKDRLRLTELGAEVINRWVDDAEMSPLFARYDAVALPYIEASQSGVAAIAFGNGLPAVGAPAGGIPEQIIDRQTGVLAKTNSARGLADAIKILATDAELYDTISANLTATVGERSMQRFVDAIVKDGILRQRSLSI